MKCIRGLGGRATCDVSLLSLMDIRKVGWNAPRAQRNFFEHLSHDEGEELLHSQPNLSHEPDIRKSQIGLKFSSFLVKKPKGERVGLGHVRQLSY